VAARLALKDGPRVRIIERPVPPNMLVAFLQEAASYIGLIRTEIPPSAASAPEGDAEALMLWDFSARAGLPEVESLLPDLDSVPLSQGLAGQLSPDIEALLDQGARRVREADAEAHPEPQDSGIALPDELLATIDELLLQDDAPVLPPEPVVAPPPSVESPGSVRSPGSSGSPPSASPASIARSPSGATPPSDAPVSAAASSAGQATLPRQRSADSSPPQTSADLSRTSADLAPLPPGVREPSEIPPPSEGFPPLTRPGRQLFSTQHPATTPHRHAPFTSAPSTAAGARSGVPFSQLEVPSSLQAPLSAGAPATHVQPPLKKRDTAPLSPIVVPPSDALPLEQRLEEGDPVHMLARAVRGRATGALLFQSADGKRARWITLREGDLVNAASNVSTEALLQFLIERGDLRPEVAELRSARLPPTGRHAAAALIANGFLGQDDLWPVLRAHAEWIIAHALRDAPALCQLEREPPERLRAEPNVFGGAAGVEVFVEAVRRVLSAEEAVARLGGNTVEMAEGQLSALLTESALSVEEMEIVKSSLGVRLSQALAPHGPELAAVLYALVALEVYAVVPRKGAALGRVDEPFDPLDVDAVRERVKARLALVHEGDYFSLLGLRPSATGYEIRRAYVELRRFFEPSRLLTPATTELAGDIELILEVLDEAYQVLRDPHRRSRYKRAIEAIAPNH
jgi:hypothetical protein